MDKVPGQTKAGETDGLRLCLKRCAIVLMDENVDGDLFMARQGRPADCGIPLRTTMRRTYAQGPPTEISQRLQAIEKVRRMPVGSIAEALTTATRQLIYLEVGPYPGAGESRPCSAER